MEILHYYDSKKNIVIESTANKFVLSIHGVEHHVSIALGFVKHLMSRIKILRRLLRLNKSNALPIFKDGNLFSIVILYQSRVWVWREGKVTPVLDLDDCRNVMHGSILQIESGEIFFGEYGSNPKRSHSVPIFRSSDYGFSWSIVYEFFAGSIKHIHNIQWDPYEEKLWVCTGDRDGESRVIKSDKFFSKVEVVGGGDQRWRTCHFFFQPSCVVWGMDSPLEKPSIMKLDRSSLTLQRVSDVLGPVWYGRQISGVGYFITTSVEPTKYEHDKKSRIYFSANLEHWEEIFSVEKDFLPYQFKYGSIHFSSGGDSLTDVFVGFEALRALDGKMFKMNSLNLKKSSTYD